MITFSLLYPIRLGKTLTIKVWSWIIIHIIHCILNVLWLRHSSEIFIIRMSYKLWDSSIHQITITPIVFWAKQMFVDIVMTRSSDFVIIISNSIPYSKKIGMSHCTNFVTGVSQLDCEIMFFGWQDVRHNEGTMCMKI